MRPITRSLELLTAMVLVAQPTLSQESRDTTRLPAEVVTATRVPGLVRSATATATVLDGAALRAEGVTHLADALRRVPGLSLARTSSYGSQTALFVRGGQSNYVRVLIDGVPVNEPGGALDLGRITLDDVERIEVVRGPASVLYGSEAVTGVIQLFTSRARGARGVDAEIGGGSFGARRASLGGSARAGLLSATVRGDHHSTDGFLPFNNAYQNDGAVASVSLDGLRRDDLRLTGRFNSSVYHYPTGSGGALEDRNAERTEHRLMLALDGGHRWSERVESRMQLSMSDVLPRSNDGADDAGDTLGFYGYYAKGTVTRRLADLRTSMRLAGNVVTGGAEFARETERSSSVSQSEYGEFPDAFRAARETRALYLQGLGDRGPVSYSIGARLDENSTYGTFRTARVGLGWRISAATRLRATFGNAFKAPSFFESSATGFTVGNPALRPERTRSADLGIESVVGGTMLLRVTAFTQRFDDLIQYTGAPPAPGEPNFYNIAKANAGGLEVEADLPEVAGTRLALAYTWTDTRVVDAGFDSGASANFVAGEPLIRRPAHRGSITLTRPVAGIGVFTAAFTGVSAREDREFSTYPATPFHMPPFATVDLAAELAPAMLAERGIRLQLRAENATATKYREIAGFKSPGRSLYAGLKLQR